MGSSRSCGARERSDVMKRIAAPMVGGVVSSLALELLIYPVIFTLWRGHGGEADGRKGRVEMDVRPSKHGGRDPK